MSKFDSYQDPKHLVERVYQAMWDNDVETLHAIAPCRCCCSDHTFITCPARIWYGCRGGGPEDLSINDIGRHYQKWYQQIRGMTEDEFYSYKVD